MKSLQNMLSAVPTLRPGKFRLKFIIFTLVFGLCFAPAVNVFAEETASAQEAHLYFFWGDGCPHCEKEQAFLDNIKYRYPTLRIHDFETWRDKKNMDLLAEIGRALKIQINGVPFTVIGDQYITGYFDDQNTGAKIQSEIEKCVRQICNDTVGSIISGSQAQQSFSQGSSVRPFNPAANFNDSQTQQVLSVLPDKLHVPIIGDIETKNLSLPVLTVLIGALDGFNPCAMWVLIFLIGLLLGMANKRRMWILGGVFIAASAAVYFLFMVAWLNLILFLGFILWIRIIIGIVAIAAGGYNLREFFVNKEAVCKVTGAEKRRKIFDKLKTIVHREEFWLALAGIIVLAFAVNLVELICSAGFPAVYTQLLAMNNLSAWQYYAYILLYLFVFMFDDLIVFLTAMITLQATGMTTKYVRASHLIGGVLMLILGVLLIIKPAWLTFG